MAWPSPLPSTLLEAVTQALAPCPARPSLAIPGRSCTPDCPAACSSAAPGPAPGPGSFPARVPALHAFPSHLPRDPCPPPAGRTATGASCQPLPRLGDSRKDRIRAALAKWDPRGSLEAPGDPSPGHFPPPLPLLSAEMGQGAGSFCSGEGTQTPHADLETPRSLGPSQAGCGGSCANLPHRPTPCQVCHGIKGRECSGGQRHCSLAPHQNTPRVPGGSGERGGRRNWRLPREGNQSFILILREASEKCF